MHAAFRLVGQLEVDDVGDTGHVVFAREDFAGLVTSSVAGMGFDRDIAMVIFPVDQFLVESDISPVERDIGEFIAGLTS